MTYGIRFGCRWGQPHDMQQIKDNPSYKIEKCSICGIRKRWNKGFKGRVKNTEYLKFHLRSYAQKGGATNRVFLKLYEPEKTIIHIN